MAEHWTDNDCRKVIRELFAAFQGLRDRDRIRTQTLYGDHGLLLKDDLARAGFSVPVPSPSPGGLRWAHDAREGLRGDIVMSASVNNSRWGKRADALEVGAAYVMRALNTGQTMVDQLDDALVSAPFAGGWLLLDPFQPPRDGDLEEYVNGRLFCHVEIDPGRGSAFAEDNGRVTLAARHIRKTIYEVATAFGKGDDPNAVRVWNEQFEGFRSMYGVDEWSDFTAPNGKLLDIWMLDDGNTIRYYCESPRGGYLPLHEQREQEIRNPIGQPLFAFGSGYYNPSAEKPENRYQPFMAPWIDQAYKVDLGESMVKSYDLSFNHRVLEIDPANVLPHIEGKSLDEQKAYLDTVMVRETGGILKVMGAFKQGGMSLSDLLRFSLDHDREQLQALLPRQPLSEQTLRNITATALAVEQQRVEDQYGSPRTAKTKFLHDIVEMVLALYRRSDSSYFRNTSKAKGLVPLLGAAYGDERVQGRDIQRGAKVYLGEEELGPDSRWYDMRVGFSDMSAQAVAARKAQADADYAAGAITEAQWFEARGITNVSEHQKDIEAERRWRQVVPAFDGVAATSALLLVSQVMGLPAQEIMAAMQGPGVLPGGEQPPGAGGGEAPAGPYQVGPPAVSQKPVAVAS